MEPVCSLLLSSTEQENENAFANVVESCQDLKCFSEDESLGKLSRSTNSLLNSLTHRHKAFELMKVHLKAGKEEEKSSSIIQWMNQTLKEIAKDSPDVVAVECFELMVSKSNDIPELRKEVAAIIIPRFFDSLRERNAASTPPILLKALDSVLRKYGKGSITFKGSMENFLFSCLDVPYLVEESSKCFVSLCLLGPPGTAGENYSKAWFNAQQYIINAMSHLVNRMFNNVPEIQNYISATTQFEYGSIRKITEKDPLVKMVKMSDRFAALSKYLSAMLLVEFPVKKDVLVNRIFNLASRILSVQANTLATTPSGETIALITQIPKIHISVLSLIEALILSCRKDLFWQSNMICKLPCQTLKWTSSKKAAYGENKPYNKLRAAAYKLLETWLVIQRTTSLTEKFSDELIPSFISDFSYSKPTVTITYKSSNAKSKAKKSAPVTTAQIREDVNQAANKEVAEACLRCLQQYIRATSNLLKPQVHRTLQEEVLKLLLAIQKVDCSSWPPPYLDVMCRLELYRTLLTLVLNSHPNFPPPINYAIPIFRDGLKDSSIEIVRFCSTALSVVGVIVRPFISTIRLPSDPPDEETPVCLTKHLTQPQLKVAEIKINGVRGSSPLLDKADEVVESHEELSDVTSPSEHSEVASPDIGAKVKCGPSDAPVGDSQPTKNTTPEPILPTRKPSTDSLIVNEPVAISIRYNEVETVPEEVDLTVDTESDGQTEEVSCKKTSSKPEVVHIVDEDDEINQKSKDVPDLEQENKLSTPPFKKRKLEISSHTDLEEKEMLDSFVDLVDDDDEGEQQSDGDMKAE